MNKGDLVQIVTGPYAGAIFMVKETFMGQHGKQVVLKDRQSELDFCRESEATLLEMAEVLTPI